MRIQKSLLAGLVMVCGVWGVVFVAPALAAPEAPEGLKATSVMATTATISGVLDPEQAPMKGESGFYFFLYGVSAPGACGEEHLVREGTGHQPEEELGMYVGNESREVDLVGLHPHSQYTFCMAARNPNNEEEIRSISVPFETLPAPPAILAESATPKAEEATLHATINPNNEETKYDFEYSTQGKTGAGEALEGTIIKDPSTPGVIPAAFEEHAVEAATEPLTPHTTYYYRVTAENTKGEKVKPGKVEDFVTGPLEAPEAGKLEANPVGKTTATLHGVLNPAGAVNPDSYEFRYAASATTCEGEGEVSSAGSGLGGEQEAVTAEIESLLPGTTYSYCLHESNDAGEEAQSTPAKFTTPSVAPTIALNSTSATEVTSESAKLNAEIIPGGGATTYHFEYDTVPYITSAPHGTSTPESGSIGSDNAEHIAPASIGGLQSSTEYHYRVVATNGAGGGAGSTVDGPDETFTTQAAKGEFSLLDDRAWEQVSPTNKYGARIEAITREGGAIAAAANGSAMTYVTNSPTTNEPAGNISLAYSQVISTRGPAGGWSSRDLAIPHTGEPKGLRTGRLGEYYAFTPNLEDGIAEPVGAPPLAPNAKENTVVIRENLLEPAGAVYTALTNENDTPPGTVFGKAVEFIASSSNLEHVLLSSNGVQLTATSGSGLYEWNRNGAGGELVPVSILPNEEFVNSLESKFGDYSVNVRNAVSEEGNLVFWSTSTLKLYMRDVPLERTVEIDLPQGVEAPEGHPEAFFQYATPDGKRVYFRDGQRLTADATATASRPDLYEYSTGTGILTDLTPDPKGQPGAGMLGELIGASDNGANVYFVAEGIFTEENPPGESEEEPNLYVIHTEGASRTTRFIATLSKEDEHDWAKQPYVGVENDLQGVTSRMSPNGEYLAFMSDSASLLGAKGYDNHDAAEPHALDEEVLEYDAGSGTVVCVSCNPTGARPQGVFDIEQSGEGLGLLVDRPEIWKNRWLAGSLPGWTARHLEQSDYQSRYLSDTGRLFFNSSDALVPQDTNGKEDVYEYEPTGAGDCTEGTSSGSSTYVPAGGCVGLISSGTSSKESAFLDASESGDDVFFLNSQPLSPADADDSGDVYDAHVCSSESRCAGVTTAAPPPCATADSCKAASGSQPAIFGASGSATFSGAGNAAAPAPAVIEKSLTRAQKLAAALKACRSKPRKRRAVCEASARKRYGPPPKSKKPSRKGRK